MKENISTNSLKKNVSKSVDNWPHRSMSKLRQRRYGHKMPFSDLLYLQLISCPTACTTVLIFLYMTHILSTYPMYNFGLSTSFGYRIINIWKRQRRYVSAVTFCPRLKNWNFAHKKGVKSVLIDIFHYQMINTSTHTIGCEFHRLSGVFWDIWNFTIKVLTRWSSCSLYIDQKVISHGFFTFYGLIYVLKRLKLHFMWKKIPIFVFTLHFYVKKCILRQCHIWSKKPYSNKKG